MKNLNFQKIDVVAEADEDAVVTLDKSGLKIGANGTDKFHVTASDGSLSAAAGKFLVGADGNLNINN